MVDADKPLGPSAHLDQSSLSYKFQRLREKLRQAVESGELAGKLPGERALAKRFHVNAKTLSKALTDLAAEGLLERSIGRGTFVKGSTSGAASNKRWLVLCDPKQAGWEIVQLLRHSHPDLEVLTDISSVRPSFLNQFTAVIDIAQETPESFIRDLVVRNIPVVVVGKAPKTFSTHSVAFDGQLAVSLLGRDLLLSGHRRLAAIEPQDCTVVAHSLRLAASRYAPEATVDAGFPEDVPTLIDNGITAFVCQNVDLATQVKQKVQALGIPIPQSVSIAAVGSASDERPVSGYFMSRAEKASAIVQLLSQPTSRPANVWLAGKFDDRGTMASLSATLSASMSQDHAGMIEPASDQQTDAA
jgi:hypothetical protein